MLTSLNSRSEWQRLFDAVAPTSLPMLAQCVRGPVLRDLALTGESAFLRTALVESGVADALGERTTLDAALRSVVALLRQKYACDYIYRTAITNTLFLRRYSPATTTLLSELRVWRSKADLAMFNGTSVAYEIKTELDNLDRLGSQLRDYSGMFDRIFVVTHENHVAAVRANAPDHVGILVLGRSLSIRVDRDACSNVEHVRADTMVDALRRKEVVDLTLRVTGSVPASTAVGLIDDCARLLALYPARVVHTAMVAVLKRRAHLTRHDFVGIAPELVCGYMETGLCGPKWHKLSASLTQTTIATLIASHGKVLPISPWQDV